MDQAAIATSSSWKLLSWPSTGSTKKPRTEKKPPKKVSALKKRLQAHAAIARSLSPFCARTSFDSATAAGEDNKCLLSLSNFMQACSRCTSSAIRDVHVPGAILHLPHQQRAYMEAVHHHLLYAHHQSKVPSSKRPQNRVFNGGDASHANVSHSSIQHRDGSASPARISIKAIELYKCDENKSSSCEQEKHQKKVQEQTEPSTRGWQNVAQKQVHHGKHKHSHHKQKDPFMKTSEKHPNEHPHHSNSSSLKETRLSCEKKVKYVQLLEPTSLSSKEIVDKTQGKPSYQRRRTTLIDADVYVCTTAHVVGQRKGKMRAFQEDMLHYHRHHHQTWGEKMHQHANNQDPPLLNYTQQKHATKNPNLVRKSNKDAVFQKRESFNETKLYLTDASSVKQAQHYSWSLKEYKENLNPSKRLSLISDTPSPPAYQAQSDPPLTRVNESSLENKDLSLKLNPMNARSKQQDRSVEVAGGSGRARQNYEKIKLMTADTLCSGIWMQNTLPIVKYSQNPYVDFHNSMLEMLLGRGLKDLHELQDMFVCYVLLNSPCNQEHIEKAFRDLLTDLYRCKWIKSLQPQLQREKTMKE